MTLSFLRNQNNHTSAVIFSLLVLAGCATTTPDKSVADLEQLVSQRVGVAFEIESRGTNNAENQADILTVDDAIAMMLRDDPEIKLALNNIEIAEAALLNARTLPNPVLNFTAREPDRSPSGLNIEFNVVGSLIQLLQRPARTKASAARVDESIANATAVILARSAEVEQRYIATQGAQHKAAMLDKVLATATAATKLADELVEAGNLSELNRSYVRAQQEQIRVEQLRAVEAWQLAITDLVRAMGQSDMALGEQIPKHLQALPDRAINNLVSSENALDNRLELAALKKAVDAAAAEQQLALDWGWLQNGSIGLSGERDTDRQLVLGPQLTIDLPFIHQGDAAKKKMSAYFSKRQLAVAKRALDIQAEVTRKKIRLENQHKIAKHYADSLVPIYESIGDLSQKHYNFMLLSTFDVINAKDKALRAEIEYVDALTNYWIAEADYRHAIGANRR